MNEVRTKFEKDGKRIFCKISLRILFFIILSVLPYGAFATTIGIFTYQVAGVPPWDPDSIQSGITGSEEAVIYMSQELSKLGYQVIVIGYPPERSKHSDTKANPRFVKLEDVKNHPFDIAISWRMPSAAKRLKTMAKKVYFWPHDTPPRYSITNDQVENFDDVLWLSSWQREQWIKKNSYFTKFENIHGNGIIPTQFKEIESRENPYSCIYGSNYARGLEILLNIWPGIKEQYPKATLDIYYGWQHWGLLSAEKEAKMRKQVEDLKTLDVRDHGLVGHEELNRAYEKASLWTYPCIAPETFCITALRAQFSGAIPVIIEGTALTETVKFGYKCSKPEEYEALLLKSMNEIHKQSLSDRRNMREFILNHYTWEVLAKKWAEIIESDKSLPITSR